MPQKLKRANPDDLLDPVTLRASVDAFDVVFDEMVEKRSVIRYNCLAADTQNVVETIYISREAWMRLGSPDKLHVRITATR